MRCPHLPGSEGEREEKLKKWAIAQATHKALKAPQGARPLGLGGGTRPCFFWRRLGLARTLYSCTAITIHQAAAGMGNAGIKSHTTRPAPGAGLCSSLAQSARGATVHTYSYRTCGGRSGFVCRVCCSRVCVRLCEKTRFCACVCVDACALGCPSICLMRMPPPHLHLSESSHPRPPSLSLPPSRRDGL